MLSCWALPHGKEECRSARCQSAMSGNGIMSRSIDHIETMRCKIATRKNGTFCYRSGLGLRLEFLGLFQKSHTDNQGVAFWPLPSKRQKMDYAVTPGVKSSPWADKNGACCFTLAASESLIAARNGGNCHSFGHATLTFFLNLANTSIFL